ncbi:MAG: hypothetical protein KH338_01260 [Oscillospiraceae bacterium]|nr:hypothetical protein [Oscillospiraceae bacterium]
MERCWDMEGGGTLSLEEEGLRLRLRAVRPDDGRGLYKAWVRGWGGSLLLGTLAPENGGLALSRTLSRSALEQAGCWPVTGGNTVLVFSFTEQKEEGEMWRPEPDPARLCMDPLLRKLLRGRTSFFSSQEGEIRLLAAPFSPHEEFPLPVLFCLAQVEERAGRLWLVWRFDRAGVPVIPVHSGNGAGHTRGAKTAHRPEGGKDHVRFDHKGAPGPV